ncbi:hypothetical protein QB607_003211 [Clostridium botulinum]|nr:hypothetical protein [Clostridium botulinum]EKS4395884.1 hypothetical protein [Clostridium botulinum]
MLNFTNKKIGEVITKTDIAEDDICNIIVSSFEGGSNYWMGLNNEGEEWEQKPKDEPLSTWATKLLLDGKSITLIDIEEDKEHIVNLKDILKGIQLNNQNRKWASDKENWDATDADCIIQYSIFNDVIYG